ncbi:MAG: sortase [Acidimicrobiia bacterium]
MTQRRVRILGWTFIWGSLLIFGYLGWELFVTDLFNSRVQAAAAADLDTTLERARANPAPTQEFQVPDTEATVAFYPEDAPEEGSGFARLSIPRLDVDVVVFQGVSRDTLAQGPGHMPGTPLPGQPGNAVISGHRTTHGRPFFDLDQLVEGDHIEIESAIGTSVYEVRSSFVVQPTDVWVAKDEIGGWLTLTTCNPKFSAKQRLIIRAELVDGPNLGYVRLLEGRSNELT